jgi:microcystin-dependent protein
MIKGINLTVNDSITNTKLHQLVESATVTKNVITDQVAIVTTEDADTLLIYDISEDVLKKASLDKIKITIVDSQVTTSKIANNAITNVKMADASVGTSEIIDGSVSKIKLASEQQIPTGVVWNYFGTTAPTGWILLDGRTIGNASSSATSRANADTADLFALLWNSLANSEAAVSTGRGASAAADYAANKTITLPDARGRILVGKDDMGGSAASRMTSGGSGLDGATLGKAGGAQTHTLTISELAVHSHLVDYVNNANTGGSAGNVGGASTSKGTQNSGLGSAHNNVQPSLIANQIIKL